MAKKPASPSLSISEQLRAVISARGLTPHAVARAAGVDPPGLLRWSKREKTLSLDTLDKVASALGLHLAEGRGGLR